MTTIYVSQKKGAKLNTGSKRHPLRTIPAAIKQAVRGDTIEIGKGRYPSFTIKGLHGRRGEEITIQGEPGAAQPVIDAHKPGGEAGYVVHCLNEGSWFTLRNLTITTSDPLVAESRAMDITTPAGLRDWLKIAGEVRMRWGDGIKFNRSGTGPTFNRILIENCHVHDLPSCALSGQLHNSRIQHCHFEHCGYPGSGYGIYAEQSNGLSIVDNTIHDCTGWGVTVAGMHRCYIARNRIYNLTARYWHYSSKKVQSASGSGGISLWGAGSVNRVKWNHVWGCHWGVRVFKSEIAATVQGNEIFDCQTAIHRQAGADVRLSGNRLWDNVVDLV